MNYRPRFTLRTLMLLMLAIAACLGWLKNREAWKFERTVNVLAPQVEDGVIVLYTRPMVIYQDEKEREAPHPVLGSRAAYCLLAAAIFPGIMALWLGAKRELPGLRGLGITLLATIALIVAIEAYFLIDSLQIKPAR